MGHACTHHDGPDPDEHPVVAVIALIAIAAAMLLIAWARLEVHGTGDLEAALMEEQAVPLTIEEAEVDAAVASSRFATGLSP